MRRVRREPAVTHKSKSNENKTRKNKLSTNFISTVVGEIEVGTAHICLFPPTPDVTCTVCSEWLGLSPGPELGGWRVLYSVIPQSMHNPETVFWDTPGIMCLWVPQLLNATLSSFLLKFQSSENYSQTDFPGPEYISWLCFVPNQNILNGDGQYFLTLLVSSFCSLVTFVSVTEGVMNNTLS